MKLFRKARRRKAGIYLVRTDKHLAPMRRENGYVGRSNNVPIRIKQHLGQDKRHVEKPWANLNPRWHVLWLPWWLSWKWVQVPLEALAIWLLLPRYNHQLNTKNPRRVPLSTQARQRLERDSRGAGYRQKVAVVQFGRRVLFWTGALAVIIGTTMTIWTGLR